MPHRQNGIVLLHDAVSRNTAGHLLQSALVERDRFASHLEYRRICETAGKSGKQIERCVIASFRIAESMALRVRQSEEADWRLTTGLAIESTLVAGGERHQTDAAQLAGL